MRLVQKIGREAYQAPGRYYGLRRPGVKGINSLDTLSDVSQSKPATVQETRLRIRTDLTQAPAAGEILWQPNSAGKESILKTLPSSRTEGGVTWHEAVRSETNALYAAVDSISLLKLFALAQEFPRGERGCLLKTKTEGAAGPLLLEF